MTNIGLPKELAKIKEEVYDKCMLQLFDYKTHAEGKEYHAAQYRLNDYHIIYRKAKITPKKVGQFVTFWKRDANGITTPFSITDTIDFYVIHTESNNGIGQFVFPKAMLIKKGIISTPEKEGKRGFRIYLPWDNVKSKQAEQTQKWQRDYFFELTHNINLALVKKMYRTSDF